MADSKAPYATKQRVTIAEVPGLRVRQLDLSFEQEVPWHYHTETTDTFFCMTGPMRVETLEPEGSHHLEPGDVLAVEPGTPHRVTPVSKDGCRFMIVQGVGRYDYVPTAGPIEGPAADTPGQN